MKVKVFNFEVSNSASHCFSTDKLTNWYADCENRLKSPVDIENTINKFLENVSNVIDIKVTAVPIDTHNENRGNIIKLYYTIMYEE